MFELVGRLDKTADLHVGVHSHSEVSIAFSNFPASVVALVKYGQRVETAQAGDKLVILTNQTPFYGESGGQTGDAGSIRADGGLAAQVDDTAKPLGRLHAHHATIASGTISVGQTVHLSVDVDRRNRIRANHSATHLLHAALRNRLGAHVTQKGSLVAASWPGIAATP